MEKTFKTLDEQIAILQRKGLVIDDISFAKDTLLRENYFFLMGYRHIFFKSEKDREFINGTTFDELYAIFNFDRQIRNILFKNILIVENNAKSIFSYQLSKNYGYKESDYLNAKNFTRDSSKKKQVNDLLKKIQRQIRINGGQHAATMHYLNNYGYLPLWIVVKVLSFGIVSELYTILKGEDQQAIAGIYNISPDDLIQYFPILANYRNLCAHEDILFDHKSQRTIVDTIYHSCLNIPRTDGMYIYGKDDLFALIIILKRVLRDADFHLMMQEISYELDILSGKLHCIRVEKVMDMMGFPQNYKDLMRMDV
ncbi:MAG: Abi family protein [Bacilli bacterium]|nr:Abi family protein [Bacilli bacterium]